MFWGLSPGGTAHESQIFPNVTVLPVWPDRPADVYVCWAHGLLVPCVLLSIVCPLPSCYLIIVSVAPPVCPSLPSFVSLFSLLVSVVLCWSVVFRRVCVMLTVQQFSACLPVFNRWGSFCCSLFYFIIKRNILLRLSSRLHLSSQSLTPTRIAFCKQPFQGHWKTCKPFIHLCICSTCFWETAIHMDSNNNFYVISDIVYFKFRNVPYVELLHCLFNCYTKNLHTIQLEIEWKWHSRRFTSYLVSVFGCLSDVF